MMTVTILAVGKLGEPFWVQAAAEYEKRLRAFCKIQVMELEEYRLPGKPSPADIAKAIEKEGRDMLAKIPPKARVVSLCIEGKPISSQDFAAFLADTAGITSQLVIVIGGSHGLWEDIKQKSDLRLSFSPMTFPHQLARIMALEQVYRGFSIGAGLPYHK